MLSGVPALTSNVVKGSQSVGCCQNVEDASPASDIVTPDGSKLVKYTLCLPERVSQLAVLPEIDNAPVAS